MRLAARQEELGRSREARVALGIVGHDGGREGRGGEAVLGALQRGRYRIRERQRAPALERDAPGVGRGGHDRPQQPDRDIAAVLGAEEVGGQAPRIGADPGDLEGLAGRGQVHQDRRHAGEAHHIGMDHTQHETAGDSRVDRVAPGGQHARGRLRGERMPGRHHPLPPHHLRHRARARRRSAALVLRGVECHGAYANIPPWLTACRSSASAPPSRWAQVPSGPT